MGTSNPVLVRILRWLGAADPRGVSTAGGVLIDREAVDLIRYQGCDLSGEDNVHPIVWR
jgi:hypothetical protein